LSFAVSFCPVASAIIDSSHVQTRGASGLTSETDCLTMFAPIEALVLSSCSKKGISAVNSDTICLGDTSI